MVHDQYQQQEFVPLADPFDDAFAINFINLNDAALDYLLIVAAIQRGDIILVDAEWITTLMTYS